MEARRQRRIRQTKLQIASVREALEHFIEREHLFRAHKLGQYAEHCAHRAAECRAKLESLLATLNAMMGTQS